ncbi:MGMT family protein [Schaalia vaccimaxillae]|uniref:MGMT family protein n=1 Tax=Schaalia vaccimaxillae TaxID=183916 RepID=UPI0003B372BB|nr:MGMT family protein [Schaalia vaccimaxillae]
MNDVLVEEVLRLVEAIPSGRAATYGLIAQVVGTGPRVVGRIMKEWGSNVPWWRVVNAHGEFPTTLRSGAREYWARERHPVVGENERLDLKRCLIEEDYLDQKLAEIRDDLRKSLREK